MGSHHSLERGSPVISKSLQVSNFRDFPLICCGTERASLVSRSLEESGPFSPVTEFDRSTLKKVEVIVNPPLLPTQVVRALLRAGADDRAVDRRGRDATAHASRLSGDVGLEIRQLLQTHEANKHAVLDLAVDNDDPAALRADSPERHRPAAQPGAGVTFATPQRPTKDHAAAKEDAISPALPSYAPTRPVRPVTDRKKPPARGGRTVRLLSATPN